MVFTSKKRLFIRDFASSQQLVVLSSRVPAIIRAIGQKCLDVYIEIPLISEEFHIQKVWLILMLLLMLIFNEKV